MSDQHNDNIREIMEHLSRQDPLVRRGLEEKARALAESINSNIFLSRYLGVPHVQSSLVHPPFVVRISVSTKIETRPQHDHLHLLLANLATAHNLDIEAYYNDAGYLNSFASLEPFLRDKFYRYLCVYHLFHKTPRP